MLSIKCNDEEYTCDFTYTDTIVCDNAAVAKNLIKFITNNNISPDDYTDIIDMHACIQLLKCPTELNDKFITYVTDICNDLPADEIKKIFNIV